MKNTPFFILCSAFLLSTFVSAQGEPMLLSSDGVINESASLNGANKTGALAQSKSDTVMEFIVDENIYGEFDLTRIDGLFDRGADHVINSELEVSWPGSANYDELIERDIGVGIIRPIGTATIRYKTTWNRLRLFATAAVSPASLSSVSYVEAVPLSDWRGEEGQDSRALIVRMREYNASGSAVNSHPGGVEVVATKYCSERDIGCNASFLQAFGSSVIGDFREHEYFVIQENNSGQFILTLEAEFKF